MYQNIPLLFNSNEHKKFGKRIITSVLSLMLFFLLNIPAMGYCDFSVSDPSFAANYSMAVNYLEWDGTVVQPWEVDPNYLLDPNTAAPPFLGCSYYGYIDRTREYTIDVFRGTSYDALVRAGFAFFDINNPNNFNYFSQDLKVYIDWNQNDEFDTGELVYEYDSDGTNPVPEFEISINVPSDAVVGTTTMRIVCDYNSNTTISACATTWGEARDFAIRVAPGNDAGATAIALEDARFAPGVQNAEVTFRNMSDKQLTSCTINWSVDGVAQTSYNWTGDLAAGESATVEVGSYDFQYKLPMASYRLQAWTTSPNGRVDEDASNDYSPTIDVQPSLTPGTYSIDRRRIQPYHYVSVVDAVDHIVSGGIFGEGELIFQIHSGTYDGQLNLTSYIGEDNQLIFESFTGNRNDVTIEHEVYGEAEDWIWRIDGVNNVHFRNLTFMMDYMEESVIGEKRNNSDIIQAPVGAKLFYIANGCDNIRFTSNNFFGVEDAPINEGFALIYSEDGSTREYANNSFNQGSISIYEGASDLDINNNTFSDFGWMGVRLMNSMNSQVIDNSFRVLNMRSAAYGVYSTDGTVISNNLFTGLNGSGDNMGAAIKVEHPTSGESAIITGNTITNCTTINGIIAEADYVNISNNTINIVSDYSYQRYGIWVMNSGSPSMPAMITRNMVTIESGNGIMLNQSHVKALYNEFNCQAEIYSGKRIFIANNTGGYVAVNMCYGTNVTGMDLNNSNGLQVYYNSISVDGQDSDHALMIDGGDLTLKRNLFVNLGQGMAVYCYYIDDLMSDNNDFYTDGDYFGEYDGYTCYDIDDWRYESGQDANSVSVMPSYESTTDLHLTHFDEALYVEFPPLFEDDLHMEFEMYDWDNEVRNVYYYGVDNLQPLVNILMQPESVVACWGSSNHKFDLIAEVTLGGTPRYQWQKDGMNIPGENDAIIYFDDVTFDMSGVYRCEVTGTGGALPVYTDDVLLYVLTDPEITKQPMSVVAGAGETAMFEVQAHVYNTGEPIERFQYQWYKGSTNNPLVNDGRITGAQASIMSITEIDPATDYANDYFVIVTGLCGATQSENFSINAPPGISITQQPMDVQECEGIQVNISVNAVPTGGGQTLTYQWFKDAMMIDGSDTRFTGFNTDLLMIDPLAVGDGGSYHVEITVQPGDVTVASDPMTLTVDPLPEIITQPMDVTVNDTRPFSLVVEAQNGSITYQWYHNDDELVGETSSTYTNPSATFSDAGEYKCLVSNDCGDVWTDIAIVTVEQYDMTGVDDAVAGGYKLMTNNPNPFEEETEIQFMVPVTTEATLVLTDNLGRNVAVLFNGTAHQGITKVRLNSVQYGLTSGMYYYTLTVKGIKLSKQLIHIK